MATPFWGLYEDLPAPSTAPTTPAPAQPTPQATSAPPSGDSSSEWVAGKNVKLLSPALRKATLIPRAATQTTQPRKSASSHTKQKDTHSEVKVIHTPQAPAQTLSALSAYATEEELEGEEYDPARPNDYEQYLIDKSQMAREEREREREQQELARERERERLREQERGQERDKEQTKVELHISGEEAFARRARLSGRAAPPPPSYSPPRTQEGANDDDEDIDGMPWDSPSAPKGNQKQQPSPLQPRSNPLSVAEKMMAKMGWKEGSGLGKSEQGITAPLTHKKTDRKSGIIVSAPPAPLKRPPPPTAAAPAPQKAKTVTSIPTETTRILLLCNMVGPGEVDEDLESEIAGECVKYGDVVKCYIYERQDTTPEEAVRIFVEFQRTESALKAYIDLNGRYFGGRVVNAHFYGEDNFHSNKFDQLNKS